MQFFFADKKAWIIDFRFCNVLYLAAILGVCIEVVDFLATPVADFRKLLFLFDAEEAATCEVGGYTRCAASCERVKHPAVLVGGGEDDARQQGERFLCGMLAAGLFPRGDGGQPPYVGHLLVVVQVFHQLVVEMMRMPGRLARPDDELRRIGEVAARDVGRRVCLCPRNDVQYLEAQFCQAVGHGEDVVVCAGNPDCAVLLLYIIEVHVNK